MSGCVLAHVLVMRAQNDPSAEAVAEIDHDGADGEADGVGKSSLKSEDEDLEETNTRFTRKAD